MLSRLDVKTDVSNIATPEGPAVRMQVIFYTRAMWDDIHQEVVDGIRAEVRRFISQDAEFRQKISDEIKAAAAVMPLEAITEAVRSAISDIKVGSK